MSSKSNNRKVPPPQLRFPDFKDAQDWEIKELNTLGALVSGLTYSPEDVRAEGLLVLRSSNVRDGSILLENNVFVRENIKGANLARPNDILICVRNGSKGLIGKNALIPEGMPMCTHGAFMTVFRAKSWKFVYQLFQTQAYRKQVDADLGATINSINGSHFLKYKFSVPGKEEQQHVADCLTSLDELIEAEKQKLEALQRHKKGMMQQLFPSEGESWPRRRFPEFEKAPEWETSKLGDRVHFASGGTPSKSNALYWNGTIPWISASSMYETSLHRSDLNITELAVHDGARLAKKGALLILVRGSMLYNRIPMGIAKVDVAFNQDVKALTPKVGVVPEFLLLQLLAFEGRIKVDNTGIGAGKIETEELRNLKIFLPSQNEQEKIVELFSSLDENLAAHAEGLAVLKDHKKGLMQGLFPTLSEVEHG